MSITQDYREELRQELIPVFRALNSNIDRFGQEAFILSVHQNPKPLVELMGRLERLVALGDFRPEDLEISLEDLTFFRTIASVCGSKDEEVPDES